MIRSQVLIAGKLWYCDNIRVLMWVVMLMDRQVTRIRRGRAAIRIGTGARDRA